MALCMGLSRWTDIRKPFWILLKQRWRDGSGISWTTCKSSAPCSRQITMPAPHHSSYFMGRCSTCHPTNTVKALKAAKRYITNIIKNSSSAPVQFPKQYAYCRYSCCKYETFIRKDLCEWTYWGRCGHHHETGNHVVPSGCNADPTTSVYSLYLTVNKHCQCQLTKKTLIKIWQPKAGLKQ